MVLISSFYVRFDGDCYELKVKNIQHLRWSYYDRSLREVFEITCDKISIIRA